jgi:FkbM family methyltransferase
MKPIIPFSLDVTGIALRIAPYVQKNLLKTVYEVVNAGFVRSDFVSARVPRDLVISSLDLPLRRRGEDYLLQNLKSLRELKETCNAEFEYGSQLVVRLDGLTLLLETGQDIQILRDIFCRGIYDLSLPKEYPLLIFDVGMNVGFASLRFATRHPGSIVVGFEPMQETYQQALRNIALNPVASTRIRTMNFGLGAETETSQIPYSYEYKGVAGIHGARNLPFGCHTELKPFELRNVSEVVMSVSEAFPGRKMILKLDCEGSEYGIVESLEEKGILGEFLAVVMEWHSVVATEEPGKLEKELVNCGFNTFMYRDENRPKTGMIYAVR